MVSDSGSREKINVIKFNKNLECTAAFGYTCNYSMNFEITICSNATTILLILNCLLHNFKYKYKVVDDIAPINSLEVTSKIS